jgi:hypothetical protein
MTSDKFEFGRVRVADIFVGERQRKDLGDLTNLAGSFGDLGQAAEAYLRKFAANLRPRLRSREFDPAREHGPVRLINLASPRTTSSNVDAVHL